MRAERATHPQKKENPFLNQWPPTATAAPIVTTVSPGAREERPEKQDNCTSCSSERGSAHLTGACSPVLGGNKRSCQVYIRRDLELAI